MSEDVGIDKPDLLLSESALLRRYLSESHRFSGEEWRQLRLVLDKLAGCVVRFGTRRYRFAQFYDVFVDGTYAFPFLTGLADLADVEREGHKLQARTARQIWDWLCLNGIRPGQTLYAEYLVAYCLSRWGAFARGHVFEASILGDLECAGISLTPHNPTTERYAPHDLYISGLGYGDVKTSLYFIDELTADTPSADFFITRLYVPRLRGHQRAVFVTADGWSHVAAEGRVTRAVPVLSFADAADHFPQVGRVQFEHSAWIVVEYGLWKRILLQWQQEVR